MERRIAKATGVATGCGEPSQVLRYEAGQEYALHPDFFSPEDAHALANGGQRVATFLLYLNSVPEHAGGATIWPHAARGGLRVQPSRGSAVLLHNTHPSGGVDERSVHCGERVVEGEKWVLSKWLRERPFAVDVEAFREGEG